MIDEPRFDLDDFHGVYERVGKRTERETKTRRCLRCAYDVPMKCLRCAYDVPMKCLRCRVAHDQDVIGGETDDGRLKCLTLLHILVSQTSLFD